ncbi:hypothetical protein HGRIS_007857 [Hohenbuehelia grisea]|uniref:Phosphoglycerate mutase-like protein n=1 Tax=Hohenbuehelia grisea TaxID=104357 RepID=A0ABR3J648_9AGAR
MIDRIYIARHGFRLNWLNTNWTSPTGLPRDPPLAAYGEAQAKELAEYFLSLPPNERPTAIFSSPYYRCLQTAEPVALALGLPIYVEHGISEWYSPVVPGTGLHPRPGSASDLQKFFPTIDPTWESLWYASRQGEDVAEVHTRTDSFLQTFVPAVEGALPYESSVPPSEAGTSGTAHARLLLVSHAATVITLARSLKGDPELPLRVGCCSLTDFVRPAGGDTFESGRRVLGAWEARKLADGAHLKQGSSREWGFEDIEVDHGKVVPDPGVPGTEQELDEPVGASPKAHRFSNL